MRRRAAPPNRRRRRRAGTSGSSARRGAGPAPRRGRRTNSRETSRETADRARTGVDPCKSIFMNDDAAGIGGRLLTAHSHSVRASFDARLFALRGAAPSLAVLNVRRCDRCTRTPHRPRTRNPLASIEPAQLRSSMVPRSHSGSTHAGCAIVSLTTVIFSACLSAVARRRRPVRLPPLHPRALHRHVTAQS